MRIATAIVALLLVAGCAGNVEPLPSSFQIRDRSIWAGTEIVIESDAFVGLERSPRIRMGGEWLPVERSGDSAFAAAVPATASGTYAVELFMDGDPESLPSVHIAGFTAARQYQTYFGLDLQVLPGSGHATIMGGTLRPGNSLTNPLTLFDLDTGAERHLSAPEFEFDGLRGPGASYRPGVFFGQVNGSIVPFRLDASGVTVLAEPPVGSARMVIEIAPGAYVRSFHHRVDALDQIYTVEETEGAVISHAAGRATFKADHTGADGLPVFSVPEGELAYVLTDVERPAGVDFSSDGERLAIVEERPTAMLRIHRAEDGTVLQERGIPGEPFAVAFDPVRPLIYVGVTGLYANWSLPTLLVFDRDTLADVTQLSTEGAGVSCSGSCYKGVIAVSAEPAVYIAASYFMPLVAYRFSIPAE